MRKEYSDEALTEDMVGSDSNPMPLFKRWLEEAIAVNCCEPNAMCLATVDSQNRADARMVLLKNFDECSFVWFTNLDSVKSRELGLNDSAALVFYWCELERQVRIRGKTSLLTSEENDQYWEKRPKNAQIGACSSDQSEQIESREALQAKFDHFNQQMSDLSVIDRPKNWGGYKLEAFTIELWKGRQSRLHDRLFFEREKSNGTWKMVRLQP